MPGTIRKAEQAIGALARDERVIGAAACGADFSTRSITPGFPEEFSCLAVGPRVREAGSSAAKANQGLRQWSTEATLPTGRVWSRDAHPAGAGTGVRDPGAGLKLYRPARDAAQTFLLVVFGILAVLAFGIPLLVAKRARADWRLELRGLLHGGGKQSREFQPILSDVRELSGAWPASEKTIPGCGRRNA